MDASGGNATDRKRLTEHIAIVGLGNIGRRHLRLTRRLRPSIKITAVRSRRDDLGSRHPMVDDSVMTLQEAIDSGVQAAIIASPAPLHIEQALSFFHARVHTLVEKPVSVSQEDIDEALRIQRKASVTCLVGYCFRHDLSARYFAQSLRDETLGELLNVQIVCSSFLPDWRPGEDFRKSVSARKETGGGVLFELSHEIDYASWLFGPLEMVFANLEDEGTFGLDVEESAELLLKNADGVEISIHLDFTSREVRRFCIARFSEGCIKWDLLDHSVGISATDREVSHKVFECERDDMYLRQINHFFDCIEKGYPPAVSLSEGVETLRLIDAARVLNQGTD